MKKILQRFCVVILIVSLMLSEIPLNGYPYGVSEVFAEGADDSKEIKEATDGNADEIKDAVIDVNENLTEEKTEEFTEGKTEEFAEEVTEKTDEDVTEKSTKEVTEETVSKDLVEATNEVKNEISEEDDEYKTDYSRINPNEKSKFTELQKELIAKGYIVPGMEDDLDKSGKQNGLKRSGSSTYGSISNKWLKVKVSNEGKFTIGNIEGDPNYTSDNNQILLYGHNNSPDTSETLIKVGN